MDIAPGSEIGFVGVRRVGPTVVEEFLPELQGARGMAVYREMGDNDPVIGGTLLALSLIMRSVTWTTVPADDSPQAREIADHVESCFLDMAGQTWETFVGEACSMLQYGWHVAEPVYRRRLGRNPGVDERGRPLPGSKHDDGRWGWAGLRPRAQDTLAGWEFDDETDAPLAMMQTHPFTARTSLIPLSRALLFRTSAARGNPEGRSILRSAYRPWYMKRRIEEIEAIGVERDLAGLPVADVPASTMRANASDSERALLASVKAMLRLVRRGEADGIVWPTEYDEAGHKLYDFRLMSSPGARQFDTSAIVTRHEQRMLLATLTDVMMLGHEGTGGLGQTGTAVTKSDLLNAALTAFVDEIAAVLTNDAIPRLVALNGWPEALSPSRVPGSVERVDLPELADYINKLAGAGMPLFPSPELEEHLHVIADLPYDPDAAEARMTAPVLPDPDAGDDPETL